MVLSDVGPYPASGDANRSWLGLVPAHWKAVRLKYLLREIDSRSTTGSEPLLSLRQSQGLVPFNKVSAKPISAQQLVGYKQVCEGDLVVNRMRASTGLVAVATMSGLVSPDYAVFRSIADINLTYLTLLFKTPAMQMRFRIESKGLGTGMAGFLRLYSDRLTAMAVPVPPRDEQDRIVAFAANVDRHYLKFIRNKRRLIELLNEQKQAIINQAVTRGLDPNVRFKPSGVEWLGEIPEHWQLGRLKYLVRNVNDQTYANGSQGIRVAMEHVESWSGRLEVPDSDVQLDSQVRKFCAGDILFGKLRPYLAKVCRPSQDGVCVSELLVLRPTDNRILPSFLEQKLRSVQIIHIVNNSTFGAKMPRADWDFIGNVVIAFPPTLDEQQQILSAIGRDTGPLDIAIWRARREIELIREYRTRLISEVVTGRIDVRGAAVEDVGPTADDAYDDLGAEGNDDDEFVDSETLEPGGEIEGDAGLLTLRATSPIMNN